MSDVIQTRREQLPPGLVALLGADFRPEQRGDVLFIPSLLSPQSMAGLAFKLSLAVSVPAATFFLWMLSQAVSRTLAGERFPGEGLGIAALIMILPVALSLLGGWYWRRAVRQQQQIDRGEFRLGLWITATHLMQRDLNGGLECVALREIARLDIYHSGRPPLAMVVVGLHGGQKLRIVADWLRGYPKNVERLRQLLTDRCKLQRRDAAKESGDKAMEWILTCDDLFDRDCPAMVQAKGADLLDGLTQLWNKHLREGLQDDGQRTFTRFDLRWGEGGTAASTDVDYYLKNHAKGAPKLRKWLLTGDPQVLLSVLARTHLRLLDRGRQDAADRILEAASQAQDLHDLHVRLARIA